MSDPLILIAKLTARPDQAEALGEGLRQLIVPTRAEAGAIEYRLHRDHEDPCVWVLYEVWRSRADLDAHFAERHTRTLMARFPALLAREMELTFCSAVAPPS